MGDTAQPPDWTATAEHTQRHDQHVNSLDGMKAALYIASACNAKHIQVPALDAGANWSGRILDLGCDREIGSNCRERLVSARVDLEKRFSGLFSASRVIDSSPVRSRGCIPRLVR